MKKKALLLTAVVLIAFVLPSCISVKEVGKLSIISTKNVSLKTDYALVASYSGGSKSDLKKSKAINIEEAVDQTIRKVPGGEFIMNAKINLVYHRISGKAFFAIEGDVYGQKSANGGAERSYRGFQTGDKVSWGNKLTGFKSGTIKSLKDDKTCLVEIEGGRTVEKKYDELSK